jgi:uncharacterized protein GlcG (DUF336 family)
VRPGTATGQNVSRPAPAAPTDGSCREFDRTIIGAIEVSGVKANEDRFVARAGIDALKPRP